MHQENRNAIEEMCFNEASSAGQAAETVVKAG